MILIESLFGQADNEIPVYDHMIRNGPSAVLFVNLPIGVDHHLIGQCMLRRPFGCLVTALFDSESDNLQPLLSKSLPDLFFDNRSLLLTTCSDGFPKYEKDWRLLQV
jgi:hypothetical protein